MQPNDKMLKYKNNLNLDTINNDNIVSVKKKNIIQV